MAIMDLILPRRCAVCGMKLLRNEKVLCTDCAEGMPLTYFWQREHNPMADKLNERIQGREQYSFAVALYFYKDGYKALSKELKYEADVKTGRYVAAALGRKILEAPFLKDVDVIVPVPLHWWRCLSRGYNQSQIIAESVVSVLNEAGRAPVAVKPDALRRTRRTKTQVHLAMKDKAANVSGAFKARFQDGLISDIPPVHILLIDDVFTSGSTLAECHKALREALVERFGHVAGSAVKISVATLAFVGD